MKNHKRYKITPYIIKTLFILIIFAGVLVIKSKASEAASWSSFIYPSGTTNISLGVAGTHAGNFAAVQDHPGWSFTGYNSVTDASLDIGFVNQSSTSVQAVALGSGTVLIASDASKKGSNGLYGCNMALIAYDNGIWGEYIHMSNLQVSDNQRVTLGQPIGTPSTYYVCGETGTPNFVHTHFAFLQPTGPTSGQYISLLNPSAQVICGATVVSDPFTPDYVHTENNLQGLTSPFNTPSCGGTGHLAITSGITTVSNATVGMPFSASYYVTNNGTGNITFNGFRFIAKGPNNQTATIQTDGGNTLTPGTGGTINISQQDFLSGCPQCLGGTYTLDAQYLDTNNTPHDLDTSGGSNNVTITVNDISTDIGVVNPHSGLWPMDVEFKRGSDGNLYEHDHQTWATGWAARDPNGVNFIGNPQPIMYSSTDMALFMRDTSGQIWDDYTSNAAWQGWHALPMNGGAAEGDITQYLNPINNATEILWVGTDGNVWHNYGNWTNAGPLTSKPAGVIFAGRVTEIANPNTQPSDDVDFYAHDTNGGIWHTTWGINGTAQWTQLPGSTIDNVTAAINYYGDGYGVEIFYVNNVDENVHYEMEPTYADNVVAGLPSGAWFAIDGAVDPSYDGFNPPVTELFVRDIYGNLWHNAYNAGAHAWNTSWDEFAGVSPVGMIGDPFVLVNSSNAFILYSHALDGNIWSNYYPWNNWGSIGATP